MLKYAVWIGATALGVAFGLVDWRAFARPWFGLALVAAAAVGAVMTLVFPFAFAGARLHLGGAILVAAAALALSGYVVVGFAWVVSAQFERLRKARSS